MFLRYRVDTNTVCKHAENDALPRNSVEDPGERSRSLYGFTERALPFHAERFSEVGS